MTTMRHFLALGGSSRLRFSEHNLAVIMRYGATITYQNRRFPMPKPSSPTGKLCSHTNDARYIISPNRVWRQLTPRNHGTRSY